MAKAVLVMDSLESCAECKLFNTDDEYPEYFCGYGHKEIEQIHRKPDWCPLIPEPERLATDDTGILSGFVAGWNACLDALEGKENE